MASKEPSRKQQMTAQEAAISALKGVPLGEKGEALLQDLRSNEKCAAAALALLRILSAQVAEEDQHAEALSMLRELIDSSGRGSFEVSSGKIAMDNVLGTSTYSGAALDGTWNFLIDDNEDGDARVCRCYHSSYPLLDAEKEADRAAMDKTFTGEETTLSGDHGFMFICDGAVHNTDEAVPKDTTIWLTGDRATKWYSYHAALATDLLLVHAATEKPYGFMIEIPDEQVVTVQKDSNGVIVGFYFETSYGDEDDEDDFEGSLASEGSDEEAN